MRILVETDAGALVEVRKLETVQNADLLLAFGGWYNDVLAHQAAEAAEKETRHERA